MSLIIVIVKIVRIVIRNVVTEIHNYMFVIRGRCRDRTGLFTSCALRNVSSRNTYRLKSPRILTDGGDKN